MFLFVIKFSLIKYEVCEIFDDFLVNFFHWFFD